MFHDFQIADFRLRISGQDWQPHFGHFARALKVFEVEYCADKIANLSVELGSDILVDINEFTEIDSFSFAEIDAWCRLYRGSDSHLFTITTQSGEVAQFLKPFDSEKMLCNFELIKQLQEVASLMRFGIWTMFGIAIAPFNAIAIHSSAIFVGDKAVLFLGESGTGKSTHTRLWREGIEGATLLNDDSPIIRVVDNRAMVYGSPWSGKTPCYKSLKKEIVAFVRLSQAPHNKIRKLSILHAIGALHPSCPPCLIKDATIEDNIYNTLSAILSRTKVYHLECLPNIEAAELSYKTTITDNAEC